MKVLLLDGHTVQTISVARSLKKEGIFVSAFIEHRISSGYASRFIDKKYICPTLKKNKLHYLSFLIDFLHNNPQDVVVPLFDDSTALLSEFKEKIELECKTRCACPKYGIFTQAHNKEKLMELCRKECLPHPRTMFLTQSNIEEATNYIGFPALIKPNISAGAKGIVFVNSMDELKAKLLAIEKEYGRCTLQKFINHSGIYYNVMLYRTKKELIAGSCIIKIKRYFPISGGTSSYCETIQNDYLIDICSKTLEKLDWNGFADFDIMEEKETGNFKIIEINPRIPSCIHAAYVSGINFPYIIVADELNLDIPQCKYSIGNVVRYLGLDIMWFIFSKNRLIFQPSWFKFWGKNIYYQDGSLKDPLPMLVGCFEGFKKYLNPSFRKSKLN